MTVYIKKLLGTCFLLLTLLACEKNEIHTAE